MSSTKELPTAILYSAAAPSDKQKQRFQDFLAKKYGPVALEWKQDDSLTGGFRLQVGPDLYDWSLEGRMRQFRFIHRGFRFQRSRKPVPGTGYGEPGRKRQRNRGSAFR